MTFLLVFALCCHLLLCSPVSSATANTANCTVSPLGQDHPECLAGTSPCRTLEYVLSNPRSCAVVNVLASQNLSSPVVVASPQNLSIIGNITKDSSIDIWCTNSSGLSFVSPQHVILENLNFVGCAARWNYTNSDGYPFIEFAGVYFYQGFDIQILGCSFSNGTGTGVIMYDVTGTNLLSGSNFVGNIPTSGAPKNVVSGGLLIKREFSSNVSSVVYHIEHCKFTENVNHANQSGFKPGSGMTLYLAATCSHSNVVIHDSYFEQNHGPLGGGVSVNHSGSFSSVVVNVTSSHFIRNSAFGAGGGMYLQLSESISMSLNLSLTDCYFVNNSAEWGGGLAVFNGNSVSNVMVKASESYWTANTATTAGFAVGLSIQAYDSGRPSSESDFLLNALFISCTFHSNRYPDSALASVGAVHVGGCRSEFHDSKFLQTFGTALYLRGFSYAVFSGNTSFCHNTRAIQGGAIYINKRSLLALKYDSVPVFLQFQNNAAIVEGGAIYSEAIGGSDTVDNNECVFESLSSLVNSPGKVMVNFSHNTANGEDRAIFVGSPERCVRGTENLLFGKNAFLYYPNETSQVASTASSVALSSSPYLKDNILQVMLGEKFYLVPNARDMFNNTAYISGNLQLVQTPNNKGYYKLVGPTIMGMDNFTEHNELCITGNISAPSREHVALHFIYNEQSSYHKVDVKLTIEIVNCRVGFAYNETAKKCHCMRSSTNSQLGNLLCPPPKSYACVRYGYWYGEPKQTDGEPIACPWVSCDYDDGNCPNDHCPLYPGFCRLDGEDDLCREGRSGLLCSSCRQNYSFNFGAKSCMRTDTCPPGITALITLSVIVYWIFFIIFVLFVLSVNNRIGSGFMYGIIYYFSVQNLFTERTVTDDFLSTLIDACTALTQLSPQAFGNFHACFVPSMNLALHHKLFSFVSPVFVITVIVIVILASRYCRCPRAISLAENSPIHAICMLILFSYTSMVYTIFYILKPIKIKGEMRVFIDPHLGYFHKEHLPYAMVALLCEFLLVLPICFLLLFAPCLSKRVNLVKLRLKPILDEFQACYRPRYRWFAGFYFLARQLVFLMYALPGDQVNNTPLRCANALVLIIHSTCQPYKIKWLNLLDSLLLIDLFLLSFFQLEWFGNIAYKIFPYILILPPAVYLILVVLLIILKRVFHCLWSTKFIKNIVQRRRKMDKELPSKVNSVTSTSVRVDEDDITLDPQMKSKSYEGSAFFRDYGEREPLLCETAPKHTSYYSDVGVRQASTTTVDRPTRLNKFATN